MRTQIVILAAGQGKRMHSDLPKVLHLLAGRSLLSHVITTARKLSQDPICIVYGHGGDQVKVALGEEQLVYALQNPQHGTGHALQQAMPYLGDAPITLVLYGDVPLVSKELLQPLINHATEQLTILSATAADPSGYGRIVRNSEHQVTAIVEDKDASPAQRSITEINSGIMALPTVRLKQWLAKLTNNNAQKEYYLTDVVGLAIADSVPVVGVCTNDAISIQGVNSRAQLAQLERHYQQQEAQRLLQAGVAISDPARIDVRGTLVCGRDVSIDINCLFEGNVRLADGVSIGAHCVLKNIEVGAQTKIEAFSYLEGASLGEGCRIGPYARIRPGTQLDHDVHIGNFVEVKASHIGPGSKANHLSYIGDAEVGCDVNIGAGTITCNYDGAYKHKTIIEDHVHIGSDVHLIAPVRVAKGATVGAGTAVWRDTPSGGLIINPKTQQHLPDWQRPQKDKP